MYQHYKKIIVFSTLIVAALVVLAMLSYFSQPDGLRVTFFDIGQGDSALVQTPSGHTILIDGGPDRSILGKLGRALPFYSRSIDMVILSHPHADHVTGLLEVMDRYKVQYVMHTGVEYGAPQYVEWMERTAQFDGDIILARAGQSFAFDETQLEVLYPFDGIAGQSFDDINESSIVVKVTYQDQSVLFTGDIGIDTEAKLLQHYEEHVLDSDVFKVGHQGSRTSSSIDFLHAVSPEQAVISVGENSFGHPHMVVLRRLAGVGADIHLTGRDGDVIIEFP